MTIEVKRSPAKVCWWVVVNGVIYNTHDRKYQANDEANDLRRAYAIA